MGNPDFSQTAYSYFSIKFHVSTLPYVSGAIVIIG
jgi:hypothetical protein